MRGPEEAMKEASMFFTICCHMYSQMMIALYRPPSDVRVSCFLENIVGDLRLGWKRKGENLLKLVADFYH